MEYNHILERSRQVAVVLLNKIDPDKPTPDHYWIHPDIRKVSKDLHWLLHSVCEWDDWLENSTEEAQKWEYKEGNYWGWDQKGWPRQNLCAEKEEVKPYDGTPWDWEKYHEEQEELKKRKVVSDLRGKKKKKKKGRQDVASSSTQQK